MEGTLKTVLVALAGNMAIAVAKFVGAFFTGSTALLAEGLHSVVDTFNEVFLFLGLHLQKRPATPKYPLGFGRERYFWSFVAAMFIFAGGSLVSLYEGVEKFFHPHPIANLPWAIGTLAFALAAEGYSFYVGFSEFSGRADDLEMALYPYFKITRDPTLLTVILEDAGAIVGILIATVGILGTFLTGDGRWDGAASIGIGLVLAVLAFVLGGRSRSLLLGVSAAPFVQDVIDEVLCDAPFVARVTEAFTIQFAPSELVLAAHLVVSDDQPISKIGPQLDALERRLQEEVPTLKRIFFEVEPPDGHAE